MAEPVTGRQIVADLEELQLVGAIDAVAVQMVRNGLAAIADRVLALDDMDGIGGHVDAVARREVLELLDPFITSPAAAAAAS